MMLKNRAIFSLIIFRVNGLSTFEHIPDGQVSLSFFQLLRYF